MSQLNFEDRVYVAVALYLAGFVPRQSVDTSHALDIASAGYGKLRKNGTFEYPLVLGAYHVPLVGERLEDALKERRVEKFVNKLHKENKHLEHDQPRKRYRNQYGAPNSRYFGSDGSDGYAGIATASAMGINPF